MKFGSLFAGIGGFDLGLERAGMECRWQVEIDPFCREVLTKHWPNVPRYGDIKEIKDGQLEPVDLICGGFPCQPWSVAGEGLGTADARWLWPDFLRIVCLVGPRYVLVENVAGLLDGGGIDAVLGGLAEGGFDAEWFTLPASFLGAPHQRERVFIVAHPKREGLQGLLDKDVCGDQRQASAKLGDRDIACGGWWGTNRADLRMGDGVSLRLAKPRVRVYGNAVCPQVVEWIGRRIMARFVQT